MLKRNLLFSIFNIAARTYSSQVVTIHTRKPIIKCPIVLASRPVTTTIRNMSCQGQIVSYEQVKAMKDDKNSLLVDVREPKELQETGVIPGSINIPLGQVEDVFKNLPEDKFEKQYGRKKPSQDFPIVFSCRSGKRSDTAMQTALKLGYCNVKNYGGGWLDWEKHL